MRTISWVVAIIVIVALGGAWYFYAQPSAGTPAQEDGHAMMEGGDMDMTPSASSGSSGTEQSITGTPDDNGIVQIAIAASNFSFDPSEIRVKQGDRVKITLTSAQGFHDWVVDEFDAKTARINTGETATVEFVADTAGTFEYYCSVGTHRQMGMVGKLIVE